METTEQIKQDIIKTLQEEFFLIPKKPATDKDRVSAFVELLINFVCEYYKTDISTMKSKSRKQDVTDIRKVICYIARTIGGIKVSTQVIGRSINRHHASVIYNSEIVNALLPYNKTLRHDVDKIKTGFLETYGEALRLTA